MLNASKGSNFLNTFPYIFLSSLSSRLITTPVSVVERINLPKSCLNFRTDSGT